ncbi:NAC domain containing protein 50-like [Forsythia ovata]|uniref:NAC domain containing protein 50-like n=1 Tax=Forsythia ovata TaxID=205694 RepID=A0ABD1X0V6_9LAMI
MVPLQIENPAESHNLPFVCKWERSEDPEPISLAQSKRSKQGDRNTSHANGSEDPTTRSQEPQTMTMMTNSSRELLEFPLLESKESHPANPPIFDSSNLEKSVHPGYLKFISNLEKRETLKIEVMRAQAIINVLQSRIDLLSKENDDLRRLV